MQFLKTRAWAYHWNAYNTIWKKKKKLRVKMCIALKLQLKRFCPVEVRIAPLFVQIRKPLGTQPPTHAVCPSPENGRDPYLRRPWSDGVFFHSCTCICRSPWRLVGVEYSNSRKSPWRTCAQNEMTRSQRVFALLSDLYNRRCRVTREVFAM